MAPFAPFLVGGCGWMGTCFVLTGVAAWMCLFFRKKWYLYGMKGYQVYFQYFNQGETGSDAYRFASPEEARAKVEELREAIVAGFDARRDLEVIDEDDFYGIMDRATGDYAKVIIEPGLGK